MEGGADNPVYAQQQTVTGEEYAPGLYGAELTLEETFEAGGQTVIVTFDGTDYECQADADWNYGAPTDPETGLPDFSEVPFYWSTGTGEIYLATGSTHTVKIVGKLMVPIWTEEIYENGYVNVADKASVSVSVVAQPVFPASITVVNNYGSSVSIAYPGSLVTDASAVKITFKTLLNGATETIEVPQQIAATVPFYNPLVSVRADAGEKLLSTPQVSTGGEVVAGADCHYISVRNGGTITIPAP